MNDGYRAEGYLVLRFRDGKLVSVPIRLDTTGLFATVTYADTCVETAHPEHRDLLEELCSAIKRQWHGATVIMGCFLPLLVGLLVQVHA